MTENLLNMPHLQAVCVFEIMVPYIRFTRGYTIYCVASDLMYVDLILGPFIVQMYNMISCLSHQEIKYLLADV